MSATRTRLYDTEGFYDEALTAEGIPRPEYELVLGKIAADPAAARAAAWSRARDLGASFGEGKGAPPFEVDPTPRIITANVWEAIEAGLVQRARALNEFIRDAYGARRIVNAGIVPERVIESSRHFEPVLGGIDLGPAPAMLAGFDLVRGGDGVFRVLEDNVRTPSGIAYAHAARRACDAWLDGAIDPNRRNFDAIFRDLAAALVEIASPGREPPNIVILSDGPENYAWYEHRLVGSTIEVAPARREDLRVRDGRLLVTGGDEYQVDVVWRRTDEDRLLDDDGKLTSLGDLLVEPIKSGKLRVANAFGSGVADDKLAHSYVEEMIRFYLDEEPRIESVPTFDLGAPADFERVRGQIEEMVIKPRGSYGGHGVAVGLQASSTELREAAERISKHPDDFVAQPIVALSRHPTVCEGRLEPRHVDLRAFAVSSGTKTTVAPGGLTRVAFEPAALMVNSTQGGGGKDTWVLR